jgi:hypothetical protein
MKGVLRYDAKEISAGDLVSSDDVLQRMEESRLVRCADRISEELLPTKEERPCPCPRRLQNSDPSWPISPTSAEDRDESKLKVLKRELVELRLFLLLL